MEKATILETVNNFIINFKEEYEDISLESKLLCNSYTDEFKKLEKLLPTTSLFDKSEQHSVYFLKKITEFESELNTIVSEFTHKTSEELYLFETFEKGSNDIGYPSILENVITNLIDSLENIFDKYKNLSLFSSLFQDNQSVCIVGANGVGKSTLMDDIKEDQLFSMFSIPAQKYMFYYQNIGNKIGIQESREIFHNQKFKNNINFTYHDENTKVFSVVLDLLMREHQACKSDTTDIKISKLDRINGFLEKIFPYLAIRVDSLEHKLVVNNNKSGHTEKYDIGFLSDGEKSVLFYLATIVLAEKDTIFVIDEPETHLNLAITIKLWDLILEERKDCKFIFISHDSQFINSRISSGIVWCKYYKNREINKLERLKNDDLKELFIEISGTQKKILFCEGSHENWDFKLYNLLFSDRYLIKPVGGHKQVIENTRALRESDIITQEVVGIIDRDFHSEDILDKYQNDGIFHLPVNEVEMLLLEEKIVTQILEKSPKNKSIEDFKKKLQETLKNNIDKMASEYVKYYLEQNLLSVENVKNYADVEQRRKQLVAKLSKKDIGEEYAKRFKKLETVFKADNYKNWLKYCSLKNEVTRGLMNRFEDMYLERAFKLIEDSYENQEELRNLINLPM